MNDDHLARLSRNGDNHVNSEPLYKFRNYVPQTHFLDGLCVTERTEPSTIKHLIKDKLDLISRDDNYRIDPKLLETKKIDWDLKRRIEKRLEMLERDTRRSIGEHIKSEKKKS